jgi:predicted PurR-regulated permease PerM
MLPPKVDSGPLGLCRLEGVTETGSQGPSVWQKLTVTCVALTAGVALHIFAFHLHDILVPFFLSGIIVFALQPACEYIYCLFAGLIPPFRWCVICAKRRSLASDRADAERKKSRDAEDDAYACCWGGETAKDVKQESKEIIQNDPLTENIPTLATMFADGLIRLFAVFCSVGMLFMVILFFFYLLGHGAMQLKDNWSAYRNGLARLKELEHQIVDQLSNDFHMEHSVDRDLKMVYDKILERASEVVWEVVNEIVRNVTEGLGSMLIMLLYVMFWLLQPLPTGGRVSAMVRSYLWKKALVSFLYGFSVAILFYCLQIDLYIFFGVISFFLNFVPEVGAFISMTIPIPVILLDGRIKHPLWVLSISLLGQIILKFAYSNVLEVKLIERDTEMNIHPVWVIAGLSYFGYIWGPMGALMSVPLMSICKMAAQSYTEGDNYGRDEVFAAVSTFFVHCCEGRPLTDAKSCGAEVLGKVEEEDDDEERPRPERRPPSASRPSPSLIPIMQGMPPQASGMSSGRGSPVLSGLGSPAVQGFKTPQGQGFEGAVSPPGSVAGGSATGSQSLATFGMPAEPPARLSEASLKRHSDVSGVSGTSEGGSAPSRGTPAGSRSPAQGPSESKG